jgi:hypothetical protein
MLKNQQKKSKVRSIIMVKSIELLPVSLLEMEG